MGSQGKTAASSPRIFILPNSSKKNVRHKWFKLSGEMNNSKNVIVDRWDCNQCHPTAKVAIAILGVPTRENINQVNSELEEMLQ